MAPSKKDFLQIAYTNITTKDGSPFADVWLCDETILRIINERYPDLGKAFEYDRRTVNVAVGKIACTYDSLSNATGVYRTDFYTSCPYSNTDKKKRKVYFYYRCTNGKPPSQPSKAPDVQDIVAQSNRMQNNRNRLSAEELQQYADDELTKNIQQVIKDNEHQKLNEKKAAENTSNKLPTNVNTNIHPISPNVRWQATQCYNHNNAGDNTMNRYWTDPEAFVLFLGYVDDGTVDVVHLLKDRIELLKSVQENEHGYQYVIPIPDEESTSSLTSNNIFVIRHKALFLTRAYQLALEKLKVGVKWLDICNEAVEELNNLGIKTTTTGETVMKWHREFRDNNDKFLHPNIYVRMGKKYRPPIFEYFPIVEAKVNEFILNNLDCFTIELLRSELETVIIPEQLADVLAQDEKDDSLGRAILEAYTKKLPSYSTVLRWVHSMKFSYDTRSKSYMVDGHEHEAQRIHRSKHTTEYLTVLELNTFRWVQMPIEEYDALPYKDEIHNMGYTYTGDDGIPMIELHVDDHDNLQKYANEKNCEFGGNTSVRMSGKPVIILGQDECIFNQFLFGNRQWVSGKGERAFLPKQAGEGLMVSGIQGREFGFGMELTPDELELVNRKRRRDGHYFDTDAAKDVLGDTRKKDLTESPFVRKLEYGANKDGYWTGNHMIIQTEDCIDVLTVLYGDKYDFVFQFDSSSGHAKKRLNGLDASKMNKSWGGPVQHPTKIEKHDGYLGPFYDPNNPRMMQVGEEQSLMWSDAPEEGDGPIYLSPEDRLLNKDDQNIALDSSKDVNKSKKQLVDEILEKDTNNILTRAELEDTTKKLVDLQKIANKLNIPITYVKTYRIKPGWRGKTKGIVDVLYERGFIDLDKFDEYRVRKLDDDGNLIPELSLQHMLENCVDFANETSQLEYVAKSLGVRVIITTKYHAEYAGEGIEYSWGYMKSLYRRQPLSAKKGRGNFLALVDRCISRDVITVDMVRKFSKRARGYMLAYKALEDESMNEVTNNQADITHKMIEKMKKVVSSHRAALDFDKGFLSKITTEEGFDLVAEVKSEKKGLSSNKKNGKRKRGVETY